MKLILILFVIFSSSYVLSKEKLIECKRLSMNQNDDSDRFSVSAILSNPLEEQKFCPLIIKTRDKAASNCDHCYLNLYQYNDKGWFPLFPCKYLGKGIELECKKDK